MSSPMLRQRAPIRRAAALLAALAAMAMLAAAACTSDGADTPDLHDADAVAADAPTGDDVGQRAPDFTVESTAGDTYSLAALTAGGDPVLLYFFATW